MLQTINILVVTTLAVLTTGTNCATGPELNKLCLKTNGLFPGTSCEKFVNCANGHATEQGCPKGLYFSPTKSHCDYPKNVDCGDKEEITDESSRLKKLCLKPRGQFPGTLCKTYVNCHDDIVIEEVCPGNFLFSPDKLYCDYPENVKCEDKKIDENSSHSSSSEEGDFILIDDKDYILCPVLKNVYIRSNTTGEYLAVDWLNRTSNFKEVIAVSKEEKEEIPMRAAWLVQFCKDNIYIHNNIRYVYMLDRRDGCNEHDSDGQMGIFPKGVDISNAGENNKFSFDNKTGILTVCGDKCVYVPEGGKKLNSTSDCSSVKDKIFHIETTTRTIKAIFRHKKISDESKSSDESKNSNEF